MTRTVAGLRRCGCRGICAPEEHARARPRGDTKGWGVEKGWERLTSKGICGGETTEAVATGVVLFGGRLLDRTEQRHLLAM